MIRKTVRARYRFRQRMISRFDSPFCGSSSDVLACPGIPSQSDEHGSVERCVGLAMGTAVEAATPSLARRCLDGADPAEGSERCLAGEAIGIVAGRDQ
jgi:hypothetical protein